MIWIILLTFSAALAFILCWPLFRSGQKTLAGLLALGLMGGTALIYQQIGEPGLTQPGALKSMTAPPGQSPMPPSQPQPRSMEQATAELEQRLTSTGSRDPQGWHLLARSQMQTGQYDKALASYEKLLDYTNNDPAIAFEIEQAKAYIANPPPAPQAQPQTELKGPSQADIKAAQSMSPADQQAMIEGMVAGLAARLYDEGGAPQEWARLLQVRKVLGQDTADDVAKIKEVYADNPETAAQILQAAGLQ